MEINKNKIADIRIETNNLYDLKGILRNLKKVFTISKPMSKKRDEGGYYHYITVCEKSDNHVNKATEDSIFADIEPNNAHLNENEIEMLYYFRKVPYRQQLKTIGNLEMISRLSEYGTYEESEIHNINNSEKRDKSHIFEFNGSPIYNGSNVNNKYTEKIVLGYGSSIFNSCTYESANQINEEIIRSPEKYGEWILKNIEAVKDNDEAFFDILDFDIPAEQLRNEYMDSMTNEEWEKLDYMPTLNAILGNKIETTMEMLLKRQLGIDNILSGCVSQEEKNSYCTLFNTLLTDVFTAEWDIRKEKKPLYNTYRKTREDHIRKLYKMLIKSNISFTNAKEIGKRLVCIIDSEE